MLILDPLLRALETNEKICWQNIKWIINLMYLSFQSSEKLIRDEIQLTFNCDAFFLSCSKNQDNVGDIIFDPSIDNPDFKICNENQIVQYYNFGKGLMYNGERFEILTHFNRNFKAPESSKSNGYLTIRFVVNCEGETGRFRVTEMGMDYQDIQFDESLKKQLLNLTKRLNGWEIGKSGERSFDYYQYLTFKIENGQLTDIMP